MNWIFDSKNFQELSGFKAFKWTNYEKCSNSCSCANLILFFQKRSSSLSIYLFIFYQNSMLLRILHCQMLAAKLHDVMPVLRNLLAEWTHACCRWSERVHTPDLRHVFVGFFAEREFCFGAGSVNLIPWLLREVLVCVRMLTVCRFTGGVRHGSFFSFFLWAPKEMERTADSGQPTRR